MGIALLLLIQRILIQFASYGDVSGIFQRQGPLYDILRDDMFSANEVEVEVNLRPTVSRPVCLGVRLPSGTRDQFFFSTVAGLLFCSALSDERAGLYLLYNCFCALPEQSLLGRIPAELTARFYCLIRDSLNLEGQILVFISPRNRVAQLYPREYSVWFGFVAE
jgi:hypothetical protein